MLILAFPRASHAKGGGSSQVDRTGPKSPELQALETSFYNIVNPLTSAYGGPLQSMPGNVSGGLSGLYDSASALNPTKGPGVANPSWGSDTGLKTLPGASGQDTGQYVNMPIHDGTTESGSNPLYRYDRLPVYGTQGSQGAQTQTPTGGGSWNHVGPDGIPQPYDNNTLAGQLFNDATRKTYESSRRYDDLLGQAGGLSAGAANMLGQAETAGDPWYGAAWDAYGDARGLINQGAASLEAGRNTNAWYDNYAQNNLTSSQRILDTGEIPQSFMDAMMSALDRSVNDTVGAQLNSLGGRGVLNSSVTSSAMGDIADAAANSMNDNYLNVINSLVGGYQGNAQTAGAVGSQLADNYLRYNDAYQNAANSMRGLGDSYGSTGSMRVGDYLNVAGGYNDALGANLAEREYLSKAPQDYFMSAAAPMMPAFSVLQQMQEDHWNSNGKDTIVKQGK